MKDLDKTFIDIDDLAKKIEARIKELEEKELKEKKKKEYVNEDLASNMADLDEIIKEIDKRIEELEKEEKVEYSCIADVCTFSICADTNFSIGK